MRKLRSILLWILPALVLLPGCSRSPNSGADTPVMEFEAQTWTLYGGEAESPQGQAAALFAQSVSDATNGAVQVELLSEQSEDAQLRFLSSEDAWRLDGRLEVVSLPFLFDSEEQAESVLDGSGGEAVSAVLAEHQLRCLGIGSEGFRCPTNTHRPIIHPDDLRGLKLRVSDTPVIQEAYGLWGADCVSAAWPIVFTALRTGTYAGQEEYLCVADSAAVQSVQSYMTQWNGIYGCVIFCMDAEVYDALAPALREIVDRCGQEAAAQLRQAHRQEEEAILTRWSRTKLIITTLTPEEADQFRQAAQPCYDRFAREYSQEFLSQFLSDADGS